MDIDFNLVNKILVVLINLMALWLSFWVYSADKKNKINRGFSILVIPNLLWIDFYYTASIINDYYLSLFFTRLTFACAFIFFIGLYYFFVIWFVEKSGKYLLFGKILIIYELFFSVLCAFTNLILPRITIGRFGIIPVFSFFGKITFHISVAVLVALVIVVLISKYFKSVRQIRVKIQYFLVGIFIFLIVNFVVGVILPIIFNINDYYYLTNYATIIFLSFTAYAIVKQDLFNIKVVFTGLFVGLTAILLATDTFVFTQDATLQILKAGILVGFLLFGYQLIKNVKHEMERREKLESLTKILETRTQDLSALLDISKIIANKEIDTKKIVQEILNTMPKNLGYLGFLSGFLILHNEENNTLYAYLTSQNFLMKKATALLEKIEKPYESFTIPLTANTLAVKCFKTQKILVSSQLSDFVSPPATRATANALQKITGSHSTMMLPVISRGKTLGVLGFSLKPAVEEIDSRMRNLAIAFTNHLAITLENARHLENIEAKTHDISSLLSISHIGASALEKETISQKMIDSIPVLFNHLNQIGGILILINEKNGDVNHYITTKEKTFQQAKKILDKNIFYKPNNLYQNNQSLITKAVQTKEIQMGEKLTDFFAGLIKPDDSRTLQKIIKVDSIAAVPILTLGKPQGVILLLLTKPLNQILQRDREIMLNFANQLGIALKNRHLYNQVVSDTKKLKTANHDLQELVESKSTFLSIASHQLRTPVSIAKGMLSMLVEGSVPLNKREEFIKRSLAGVERLGNIINDLLSASATESKNYKINKKPTQLADLVDKVIKERSVKAQVKNLEMVYHTLNTSLPLIEIDENKITEVVSNLIDNAIQYTLTGKIDVDLSHKDNLIIFRIKDTGIGINPKEMPRLFKKVSRLPNAISVRPDGTGLGLFLVKQIVEAHHGKVFVESDGINGHGSTFSFQLPLK